MNEVKEWRKIINKYGRKYFELQDMIQLGFLEMAPEDADKLLEGTKEVIRLDNKIRNKDRQIHALGNIEAMLKEIRRKRIERVKKERAERKIRKAAEKKERQAKEEKRRSETPPYLGDQVSAGLKFEGANLEKLKKWDLPPIHNATEFAEAVGITTKQVSWLSYHRVTAQTDHYSRFQIPKRKGGFRTIAAPKPLLRKAQSWLLKNILEKIPVTDSAKAFRPNCSVADNAKAHQGAGVLVKMDLQDFFPSVKFKRVKGLFQMLGYNEGIASIFALICTDAARINAQLGDKNFYVALGERYLPQGACTSPAISNIICYRLDKRMKGLADKLGFNYTRYADDLAFSHSNKDQAVSRLIKCAKTIIYKENFILHPDKLVVLRPHHRQSLTGVVINEKPNLSRRDLKRFRSFLHHYDRYGEFEMSRRMGKNAKAYGKGYWSYLNMINADKAQQLLTKHPWLKQA